MAVTLAYPRADRVFTIGDKRPVAYARLFVDDVQVDPTSRTLTATMQLFEDDTLTGDPVDALTPTVVDDPVNAGEKIVLVSIDATGLTAGRYRWELHQSETGGDDYPPIGGYIVVVARIAEPA